MNGNTCIPTLALAWSLLLGAWAAAATARALPDALCATRLPVTIRVAVPARLTKGGGYQPLRRATERAMAPLVRAAAAPDDPCARQQRYEVILAIGSDYEVLDWLSHGEVDAALISSLGFWLLRRDGVDLIDFTPTAAATPRAAEARVAAIEQAETATPTISDQPAALLTRYREQLLCRASWALQDEGTMPAESLLHECRQPRPPAPPTDPRLAIETPCHRDAALVPRYRPVAPNHLSELGFVFPLRSNRRWLTERLNGQLDEDTHRALESRFEQAFACDLRLSLDHDPLDRLDGAHRPLTLPAARGPDGKIPPAPVTTEILFSRGDPQRPNTARLRPNPGVVGHDHWVMSKARAAAVLGEPERLAAMFTAGRLALVPQVACQYRALFHVAPDALSTGCIDEASHAGLSRLLASLLHTDRGFGTRTMAFTADEVVRLLRAQQRHPTRESKLALVLPGGGVKSTYQSVLLDRLYGSGRLQNTLTPPAREAAAATPDDADPPPLSVHHVIGTSGGALIGYFVAQLDAHGPFDLTHLLWEKRGSDTDPDAPARKLRSRDVFGPTDILRYISLIVAFAVLAGFLAALALRAPRPEAPRLPRRGWLFATFGTLLVATPLVVAFTSAASFQEHVPEIEGLLFMMLLFLVMTADQCLIREPVVGKQPHGHANGAASVARLAIAIGAAAMALPLAGRLALALAPASWPDLTRGLFAIQANVGLCYFVLSLATVFGLVALPIRASHAPSWAWRGPLIAFVDYLSCSLLALSVVLLPDLTVGTASLPIFFWGLAAPVLLWLLFNNLRRGRQRFAAWRWRATYYAGLTIGNAVILALCLPARPDLSHPLLTLGATSRLGTFAGSLLVTTGAVTLAYGLMLWLIRSGRGYRFRDLRRFASGLAVMIGHAGAVQVVLWLLEWRMPDRVPTLELDGRYWRWLIGLSLVGGLLLLTACRVVHQRAREEAPGRTSWPRAKLRGGCRMVADGIAFLIEPHPSRPLLSLRFMRLGALAVFGVLWWNVLLAPALYGNRLARETLDGAVRAFEAARSNNGGPRAAGGDHTASGMPSFTATFVAPANELATDGTRFFLFQPAGGRAATVPEHAQSGSRWLCYQMPGPGADGQPERRLESCPRTPTRALLLDVIFASGSPFPIFAPHRVGAAIDGRDQMVLIDGGYSNVVPVEAAQALGSDQVLVLRSSHPSPLTGKSVLGGLVQRWLSPLVKNLGRLPGFLFERSQRVDRLSGQDLFVVSLAPLREHRRWPKLYHFQESVIDNLMKIAESDLNERIGFVESWGQPVPRLTLALSAAADGLATSPPDR